MFLNFIGRGSAFNVKEGNNSAYFKNDNEMFLIDCGESVFERIADKNLLDKIKRVNVLITHLHSDHIGSLSSLIFYCYYIKKIKVNVYFPNEDLKNILKIQGNADGVHYSFIKLNVHEDNMISSIKIRPEMVNHSPALICFGYLIYAEEKLIWFSGDSCCVSDIIDKYDIDEFYQDACIADYKGNVHTPLRVLCENIPKEKRHKVYCMHIDSRELISRAEKEGFNVVKVL